MKILINILLLFIGITLNGYTQNLVPNGSFEEKTDCPTHELMEFDLVKNWFSPIPSALNSPDYQNRCYQNYPTYMNFNPRSGDGCIAIGLYGPYEYFGFAKEYISIRLRQPLSIGVNYKIKYWMKLTSFCIYAIDNFSVLFTLDSIHEDDAIAMCKLDPQFQYSNGYLTDTSNWIPVEGELLADKAYQYITIGNFVSNPLVNYITVNQAMPGAAWYYYDDVVIYESGSIVRIADAGPNQTSCLGDSIQLGTREEPDYMYYWEGSDGTRYTGGKPWVKPLKTTTYTLYQKDFKYDESISSVTITVDDCIELEVPNVITPNGDGKNDVLTIANPLDHPYRLIIYNRWGQQVFEGNNTRVWEGTCKNQDLAEGVYYYSLSVWSTHGEHREKSGIIHLFRSE